AVRDDITNEQPTINRPDRPRYKSVQHVFSRGRRRGTEKLIFAILSVADPLGKVIEKIAISFLLRKIHHVEEAEDQNRDQRKRDDAGGLGRAGKRYQRAYKGKAPGFG